jgi:hypothetical protein
VTQVFVFGSNLAGRHGKGAALYARRTYGAVYGVGEGRTGNSYAIPTKGHHLEILPLSEIQANLIKFAAYARANPDDTFLLTPIGCGLAGYSQEEIRPLVWRANMPSNVMLTKEWNDDA